jgi:hypothetical protein
LRQLADVIFSEDQAQIDVGHSAENMGIFRRLIMNMAVIVDPERGSYCFWSWVG